VYPVACVAPAAATAAAATAVVGGGVPAYQHPVHAYSHDHPPGNSQKADGINAKAVVVAMPQLQTQPRSRREMLLWNYSGFVTILCLLLIVKLFTAVMVCGV
jgi:hypothetical protein